ncbi:MAG: nicotinate phosphoribosyltransferase [Cytophagales bacterium]|jgi:nicotinamide phosphoribosyltransferase|nr:nicotinate phosphoribosyltransferase [Cytophagales bacterium]MCA6386533.1 nicotinate phosphoribosyltransferase [Cytophagales bacterium]MCA6389957.1 nicotinate phosphoribosyltransferase [Cytophagales bacterium]MCA6395090.1 nicotinate phosphoribosyltransferase [Cytophagales bacterium]MCA6398117.1 nicotinate phosphoribosyltransferase [Cytophagales bacterium]
MKTHNLLLLADAYKYSHYKLYAPGTTKIYSYLESRGGMFDETIFYGLYYFLKEYLTGQGFTKENIDEAEEVLNGVFGRRGVFKRENFDYILDKYNGRLPIRIKAVPEGSAVPVKNVLMTIENTDPSCFWLTNFLETLLMQVWYPSTVATLSREIRKTVEHYFELTADDASKASIDFVLNDFGFRGVSSVESAGLGGSAHLINFKGSDTVYASAFAKKYYGARKVYGMSVPATEHSIMTLKGADGEKEIFDHVLNAYPEGILSCVSDSYNIFNAVGELWGREFKDKILQRNGTLVIRPDSGDPVQTLLKVFEMLFDRFGFTTNSKGYRVLPKQVRVIQGDGIDYESIQLIYKTLMAKGISAENLLLGMGGALLQKVNRDTQKFALKCSYAEVNGEIVSVQKSPTEMNEQRELVKSFKTSKAGRLKLIETETGLKTVGESESGEDVLETVFENGEIRKSCNFEEIRERAAIHNLVLA